MTHRFIAACVCALILTPAQNARAIVAGVDAAEGDYPWMAAVIRKGVVPGPGLIGGGVLVGDQWVATTAHSVVNLAASDIEIWLGAGDLADTPSRMVLQVLSIIRHPDFAVQSGTSTHDLALLLLDRRVASVAPVPVLSNPADLLEGDPVSVAGWGTVTPGMIAPHLLLQEAAAEIVAEAEAEMAFGPILDESHLAAVDPLGIATPCVGDSGGPLVRNSGGDEVLVGLVSFGTAECDDATQPTVYTRLSYFFSWIEERLDLTAAPAPFSVSGKGRNIRSGEAPKARKGTDFETLKGRATSRTRRFQIANPGSGWLTIQSAAVSGRGFSLRKAPGAIVLPGGSTTLKVKLSNRSGRPRYRGRLLLRTNQPDRPLFILRMEGRSS